MPPVPRRGMTMGEKMIWIEGYNCGCSSDAPLKRELLGYCKHHGNERRELYHVPDAPEQVEGSAHTEGEKP